MTSQEDLILSCLGLAVDKLASKPTCLDLRNLSTLTDYFLIATISNAKQGQAIMDGIEKYLSKTHGVKALSITGTEQGEWVLGDFGSFFIHLFQPAARESYNLETLWAKARVIDLAEEELRYRYHQLVQTQQTRDHS